MVAVMATITTAITVLETIDTVIKMGKEFMKKVTEEDIKKAVIPVHCDLAVSFKGLEKEDVLAMDENLKIIIAGSTRAIGKLKDVSWKSITSCMNQNSLLKIIEGSKVMRADHIIKSGTNVFKCFEHDVDAAIVKEVNKWFVKLIQDSDVLADTRIDIDTLAQIVATTGTAITTFESFFAKKEYVERQVVDIGILRYPNPKNPFFKLYRIELKAWRGSLRVLFVGKDSNGISGVYNCVKYEPRDNVIRKLKPATKSKASKEAEDLFK